MEKQKRDMVTSEMRENLSVNRDGKLSSGQWKQIVTEPLVKLLLLMIPGLVVLGPRIASFIIGGLWISIVVLVGLGLMLLARAIRYARMPLYFGIFQAADSQHPRWMFWKGNVLYTEANKPIRFGTQLTPRTRLQAGQPYLVYYLKEEKNYVLLSIAPADHVDAARWQPTPAFQGRSAQRSRH